MSEQKHHDGSVVVATPSPFPPLPVEIVRWILELSAYEDRSTSSTLVRLCKEVQKWITPLLYKTVILRSAKQLIAFTQTVETSNLGDGVRILVIRVWGFGRISPDSSRAVRCCPQLDTLLTSVYTSRPLLADKDGVWHPRPRHGMFLERIAMMPPGTAQLSHPLIQNITHLCMFNLHAMDSFEGKLEVTALLSITSLTHLALENVPFGHHFVGYVKRLLQESLSLRVLLVLSTSRFRVGELTWSAWRLAQLMDERLYVGHAPRIEEIIRLVTSGRTIWDDAETKYKGWRDGVVCGPHPFSIMDYFWDEESDAED